MEAYPTESEDCWFIRSSIIFALFVCQSRCPVFMFRVFAYSTKAAHAPGPQAFWFLAAVSRSFFASSVMAASMKYLSLTL